MQTHPSWSMPWIPMPFQYTKPDEILETLKAQISKDFPALSKCSYKVKYVPKALEGSLSPAFYLVPPLDRYQDNVVYINRGTRFQNEDLFPTLAHEGYPGHLYQNVYFISNNTCDLRKIFVLLQLFGRLGHLCRVLFLHARQWNSIRAWGSFWPTIRHLSRPACTARYRHN